MFLSLNSARRRMENMQEQETIVVSVRSNEATMFQNPTVQHTKEINCDFPRRRKDEEKQEQLHFNKRQGKRRFIYCSPRSSKHNELHERFLFVNTDQRERDFRNRFDTEMVSSERSQQLNLSMSVPELRELKILPNAIQHLQTQREAPSQDSIPELRLPPRVATDEVIAA